MRGVYFAAQARDAHLQAVQVAHVVDLLAEPTAHLRPGVAGHPGDEALLGIKLVPHLVPAAEVAPRVELLGVHAPGHRAGELRRRHLAGPVVRGAVHHLDAAFLHRVEHAERGHQLAGTVHLDVQLTFGHLAQVIGHQGQVRAQHRGGGAEAVRQAPAELRLGVRRLARVGNSRERRGCCRRASLLQE